MPAPLRQVGGENTLYVVFTSLRGTAYYECDTHMGTIRILIADDHGIIRRGLRTLLEHEPGLEVIAEACDGREAIEAAKRERPHVVILDIGMPNLNGIEAGRRISEMLPETQVVMLTV